MRDRGERQHIFDNSVLVLSKCDKIRPGLEGRIMSLIDLSSPNIADYPFKYDCVAPLKTVRLNSTLNGCNNLVSRLTGTWWVW